MPSVLFSRVWHEEESVSDDSSVELAQPFQTVDEVVVEFSTSRGEKASLRLHGDNGCGGSGPEADYARAEGGHL
jgi:hypothetical protein